MKYSVPADNIHNIIPTPEAQGTSRKKGVERLARARGPRTTLPGMVRICARLGLGGERQQRWRMPGTFWLTSLANLVSSSFIKRSCVQKDKKHSPPRKT